MIWWLHLGLTILADDKVALFIFFNHYIVKSLTQNSQPTLKTTYHSGEQTKRPTIGKESSRVNYIGDNNLMR